MGHKLQRMHRLEHKPKCTIAKKTKAMNKSVHKLSICFLTLEHCTYLM